MKYFFIDKDFKVTYDDLLNHINCNLEFNSIYGDILSIINKITKSNKFTNIDEMLNYIANSNNTTLEIKTSGTTAKPKTIQQNFKNVIRYVKKTGADDIWAFAYNPNHFAGLQVLFQALINKNTIIFIFNKDFSDMPNILEVNNVTHLSCTPTFMKMLIPHMYRINSLKSVSFGGERLSQKLVRDVQDILPDVKIRNIYASSEAGSVLASDGEGFYIPDRYKNFVKIIDNELCIHKTLLGNFDLSGDWYHTGDIVKHVSSKKFVFDTRESEIINIGGYRVSPSKIENFISKLTGVKDVIVYSRKNSLLGNIMIADVVCETNQASIKSKIKNTNQLLDYEKPLQIKFVDSLELTNTGKVKRI